MRDNLCLWSSVFPDASDVGVGSSLFQSPRQTTTWEKRVGAWVEATQAPTHFSHAFFSLSLISGSLEQARLVDAYQNRRASN